MVVGVVGIAPALAWAQPTIGGPGDLIVEQTVQGHGSATFGFHVKCDNGLDRDFTLNANASTEFSSIPNGTVCVVAETDTGGADSTTATPADRTVMIPRDDTITVSFVNVFKAPTTTTTTTMEPSTTTTTATTLAPAVAPTTTTTAAPTVLGAILTAPPAPPVAPAELPRTGSSTAPTLVTAGLILTALGITLRRQATRRRAALR